MDNHNKKTHFPLFVETANRKVIIFGGGKIATRRCETLDKFGFDITLVAPKISTAILNLEMREKIKIKKLPFCESQITNQFMVLACTDDRLTNKKIGEIARSKNILVSVCDCKEECTFYFPAIAMGEDITVGIVGNGDNHALVKESAMQIRDVIKG